MPPRHRSNTLALAVLVCLAERPMHPYEVATTLRQRHKHDSVKLNYGSLYSTVDSLEKRGLVAARHTERSGRLPERTVYELTERGGREMQDWLSDLLSTPVKEYPAFEAALSFMPAMPPDLALSLLKERARRLEIVLAQGETVRELVARRRLPRLLWVEHQYEMRLLEAEYAFVTELVGDIEAGELEGVDFWRQVHEDGLPVHEPAEWLDLRGSEASDYGRGVGDE